MIVNCEKCKTGFNLDEELIGESGSKVRCSKCHHIFTAYRAPLAGETGPGAEEELGADQRTDLAQAPSSLAEDGESEAQPPEGPEEDTEEALEFGLFESEEKAGEEISLADLGLEEEPGAEAPAAPTEQEVEPDEITAEDLGFGEEAASEEKLGEELSLEDLSLDEEVVSEEAPSLAEEEISLEDLGIEEEPVSEEPAPAAEGPAPEEELGEELSLEDLSLDEEVVSEEPPSLVEEEISLEDLGI